MLTGFSFLEKISQSNEKFQFIVESLIKHFGASSPEYGYGENVKYYLKFSAGNTKNINGEFSKVPADSNK